jgi:predicted branched-subunit amino acid permease
VPTNKQLGPAPAWTRTATATGCFLRGLAAASVSAAGWILAATGIGFGALAHDLGFTLWHMLFISATIFALPAQVLVIDELARGAGVAGAALAVGLTAVRLLPMTVSIMPLIRDETKPRWLHLYAVHFLAITAWLEGYRLLPGLPARVRLPFFAGQGTGFMALMSFGGATGYLLSSGLPPVLTAALLLMTPIYFTCSLLVAARARTDYAAILAGGVLAPVAYKLLPGFDLMIAGFAGGTIAWLAGRAGRIRA